MTPDGDDDGTRGWYRRATGSSLPRRLDCRHDPAPASPSRPKRLGRGTDPYGCIDQSDASALRLDRDVSNLRSLLATYECEGLEPLARHQIAAHFRFADAVSTSKTGVDGSLRFLAL